MPQSRSLTVWPTVQRDISKRDGPGFVRGLPRGILCVNLGARVARAAHHPPPAPSAAAAPRPQPATCTTPTTRPSSSPRSAPSEAVGAGWSRPPVLRHSSADGSMLTPPHTHTLGRTHTHADCPASTNQPIACPNGFYGATTGLRTSNCTGPW